MYKANSKTVYTLRAVLTVYALPVTAVSGGAAAIYPYAGMAFALLTGAVWIAVCLWYIPSYCSRYCISVNEKYLMIYSGVLTRKTVKLRISEIQYCEIVSLVPKKLLNASFVRIYTCGGKITSCPFDTVKASELIRELSV